MWRVFSVAIIFLAATVMPADENAVARITILFDNTTALEGTEPGWGFACLVEAAGGTVLFDTGADGKVLRQNLSKLALDLDDVDAIVLSHRHGDHTNGLAEAMRSTGGVPVYSPASAASEVEDVVLGARGRVLSVTEPVEVVPGMWSTGEIEGPVAEQGLVVETPEGPVVITGCAHPGIVRLARRAATVSQQPPTMVLGGFHLLRSSSDDVSVVINDLRALGVVKAAPTHCTGEEAIEAFHGSFVDDFTTLGVGAVVELGG